MSGVVDQHLNLIFILFEIIISVLWYKNHPVQYGGWMDYYRQQLNILYYTEFRYFAHLIHIISVWMGNVILKKSSSIIVI